MLSKTENKLCIMEKGAIWESYRTWVRGKWDVYHRHSAPRSCAWRGCVSSTKLSYLEVTLLFTSWSQCTESSVLISLTREITWNAEFNNYIREAAHQIINWQRKITWQSTVLENQILMEISPHKFHSPFKCVLNWYDLKGSLYFCSLTYKLRTR